MTIGATDAIVVVDVQNDFTSGGALPVPDGQHVVRAVNRLLPKFSNYVFTRDWHPADHCSFALEPEFVDGSWPAHCVAHSPGAAFHGDLHVPVDAIVVDKGTDPDAEQYSAFEDPDLAQTLRDRGIERLFVMGLATDFCVKETALGALESGFKVVLVLDGCRAIDSPAGTGQAALDEMEAAGATFVKSRDLLE